MNTPAILRAAPQITSRARARARRLTMRSRREFLQLPIARRRQLLKSQALSAQAYYAKDNDWRVWETADLTGA